MASAIKATKTLSVPARGVEAVWRAVEILRVNDPKRLAEAMLEIASDELMRNTRFLQRVGAQYDALAPAPKASPKPKAKQLKAPLLDLVPRKHIPGREFDISAPPDPYFLNELFGIDQLPVALKEYTVPALRIAVAMIQERRPGTKPTGTSKAAIIEYVLEYVAS